MKSSQNRGVLQSINLSQSEFGEANGIPDQVKKIDFDLNPLGKHF